MKHRDFNLLVFKIYIVLRSYFTHLIFSTNKIAMVYE